MAEKKKSTATKKKLPVKKTATKKAAAKKPATKKPSVFVLPAIADITYTEDFFKEMNALIDKDPQEIRLDGSEVTRITTPTIQVMLATAQSITASKGEFIIGKPSEVMVDAFNDLGLDKELTQWSN